MRIKNDATTLKKNLIRLQDAINGNKLYLVSAYSGDCIRNISLMESDNNL